MVTFLYWFHWAIIAAFAGGSVYLIAGGTSWVARVYVAMVLGLQVIYDGCIITTIQSYYSEKAGLGPINKHFIMTNATNNKWIILGYKVFFAVIAIWLLVEVYNKAKRN